MNVDLPSTCHPEKLRFVGEMCTACYHTARMTNPSARQKVREAKRRWRQNHPESHAAQNLKQYYKHHESRKERMRNRYRANRPVILKRSNCARYGITPIDYDALFVNQNGLCAICGQPDRAGKMLSIDHCHKTGKVRALLCACCNGGLGLFSDDVELLKLAIEYLESHKQKEKI